MVQFLDMKPKMIFQITVEPEADILSILKALAETGHN